MLDRTKIPQVSKDLLAVADYIREHGWCQRICETVDGRVCMSGALDKVVGSSYLKSVGWLSPKYHEVWTLLTARFGMPPSQWNDAPCRTKEEVIEMLEKIAWEEASAAQSQA